MSDGTEADLRALRAEMTQLREDLSKISGTMQDVIRHGGAEAMQRAQRSAEQAQDKAKRTAQSLVDEIEGRPVTSALAAFSAGIVVVFVAVGSGFAAYDTVSVTVHVIQHVLLMMVAPPLLALGKPVTLLTQAASRANQVRVLKVVHSPVVAALPFPVVAWFLYYGTMYAYFMTGLYAYSISHPLFHDATHLWFFAVGYLFWHPIVGLDPARWRWPHPVRMASLFLGMPFEAFLGIGIAQLPRPLDQINTLAATHSAGDTFWIVSMMATGLCLAVVVLQWFRQLDRETVRVDRRIEATTAENRARAEDLGIDLPEGCTVPWWRLEELELQKVRQQAASGPTTD